MTLCFLHLLLSFLAIFTVLASHFLLVLFLESEVNLPLFTEFKERAFGCFFMKIKEKSINLFNYIFIEIIVLRVAFDFIFTFIVESCDERFLICLFYIIERLRFFIFLNFNHNVTCLRSYYNRLLAFLFNLSSSFSPFSSLLLS